MTTLREFTDVVRGLSDEDFHKAWDVFKIEYGHRAALATRAFAKGDKVAFTHKGDRHVGVVDRVNVKSVGVEVTHTNGVGLAFSRKWRVAPGLLDRLEE